MKIVPFVIFIISIFLTKPCFAALENLVQEFQKTKDKVERTEIEQRKLLGSLFSINKSIKKVVTEKSRLDEEKILVESNVKDLASKTMELEQKTKEQKMHLRQRLSVIYRLGGAGIARVLFSSSSSAQLERNLKVLGVVAKTDIQLIKDYTASQKDLIRKKSRLTKRWEKLKEIEARIAKKEEKFLAQNEEKMQILEEVKKTQAKALSKLSSIRKKSRQLASVDEEGVLDLLFQASFAEKKGMLEKPVQGQLSQGYGIVRDETNQLVFSHRGQLYTTGGNFPVKAIFNGLVAFAGDVAGYGQTVILDHGDHYYSVYAHLDKLSVKTGDQVKEQERFAVSGDLSGRSGLEKMKGIYFEIRHFSEPSDPKFWVKGT